MTSEKALAGQTAEACGMSSLAIRVGRMTLKPETKYSCVSVSIGFARALGARFVSGWTETYGHELRCEDRVAEADFRPEGLELWRSFSTEALDTRVF